MKRCDSCLMPEGRFNTRLNEQGICNYCTYWDANRARFSDFRELKARLTEKLNRYKGQFEYDALVGVSGGKDSTYIAYKLARDYGLKVLTMTYDNGFLTHIAKRNVETVTKKLGLPHLFHYPNWDVHRTFYQVAFERLGDPCVACAISGYFLATKICYEKQIPIFVHGRSPYQMFRNYYEGSRDVFVPMMEANLKKLTFADVAKMYGIMEKHIKGSINQFFTDEAARQKVYDEFFLDSSLVNETFAPEFVGFFLFEPYDEDKIKKTIEQDLGWERSKTHDGALSHSDCAIHDAAVYMYGDIQGMSMLVPEVAVMLRRGVITKERAEEIVAGGTPERGLLEESVCQFCEKLAISRERFDGTLAALKGRRTGKFDSH